MAKSPLENRFQKEPLFANTAPLNVVVTSLCQSTPPRVSKIWTLSVGIFCTIERRFLLRMVLGICWFTRTANICNRTTDVASTTHDLKSVVTTLRRIASSTKTLSTKCTSKPPSKWPNIWRLVSIRPMLLRLGAPNHRYCRFSSALFKFDFCVSKKVA